MNKSLRHKILDYFIAWHKIDPTKFINGGEIERLALSKGYKASNASRRLRELADERWLTRRENAKGHVEYKYLGASMDNLNIIIDKLNWKDRGTIEI